MTRDPAHASRQLTARIRAAYVSAIELSTLPPAKVAELKAALLPPIGTQLDIEEGASWPA